MVCCLAGVSFTESSVRSFTPPSLQRHSAAELRAHWTAAHARDWQCVNRVTLEAPIKTNFKEMKQLYRAVKKLEEDRINLKTQNEALLQFPFLSRDVL